jgi:type VII secretion-associated serine protease mycosin
MAFADEVRDKQWHLQALGVQQAHSLSRGAGIKVGVVDTGVWAEHPDLVGAVLPGAATVGGDGRKDLNGHGTAMASLIAGRGHGEGAGVLGIAPESTILPIVISDGIVNSDAIVTEGLDWLVSHGATVINMSIGGAATSRQVHDSLREAVAADVVVVAAAGNTSKPQEIYPGAYPEVLAVGSTDRNGQLSPASVAGRHVDLVAPGDNITAAGKDMAAPYTSGTGTSAAAAVVSGAAALVRAKFPNLSGAEVIHRLTATAIDKGPPGRDDQYGYGELNLIGALTADVPPLEAASSSPGRPPGGAAPPADDDDTIKVALFLAGLALVVTVPVIIVIVFVARRRRRSQ